MNTLMLIGFFLFIIMMILRLLGITPKTAYYKPAYNNAKRFLSSANPESVSDAQKASELIKLVNKFSHNSETQDQVQDLFAEWKVKFDMQDDF